MDPSLSMHRNGLESMDMNQFQGDANKLNPSVLRGIEGNTLYTHIISIPRNSGNEYIDHALLSPEYIAAQIQSGLVVDIIQSQSHDQQTTIASHNIYNSEAIEQNASPLEMTTARHFIANNENVQMPMESIHQSLHSNHSSISTEHLSHRNHFESSSNIAEERKVIIGEQGRQYILTNEAPVIVSNKEATPMSMNGLDFSNTFNQINQTGMHIMTKASSSRLDDQHELDAKIQANALPPLPPLTPITKLQTMRKTPTIEEQQTMQYKTSVHSSASLNLSKNNKMCFVTDEDDVNFVQSNVKLIRQSSKEQSQTIAPKKSLPHKKRITKKLKSTYQSQHADLAQLQPQSHHEQSSYTVSSHEQSDTLNLTMNQQPIQLTTRINQSSRIDQTEYIQSDHFSSTSEAAISMHTVQIHQMPISETQPTRYACDIQKFTCELCGVQTQSQLSFFNHLKLHYEPETIPQNCTKIDNVQNSTDLVLEQNDQSIFQMSNDKSINASAVIMTDNFVRLQNNEQEQDFGCISGIGNEDVTDDESINGYNDTDLNVKSEQNNEFSDTEDMLENGVLDKVQRVVDSYIENGTSDVKNFIDLNGNQHHSLVDNSCNWTTATNNAHNLPNNSLYDIEKSESVNSMNDNSFVITSNNQNGKETTIQSTQNHITGNSNQTVIERHEELTLMYDINVNDKDFSIMDDASTESILRRQLVRTENVVNLSNQNQFEPQTEAADSKIGIISMDDRDMSRFMTESTGPIGSTASTNSTTTTTTVTTTKVNIQDEFIEEEQTDSDVDPSKPDAPKRKKKIYRCKRCNKLCNSKNALHYHFLSHTGERPHQCNECGKSFFAGSALKVHKRLHSGDKPYSCDFCHRPFRQWGDLKYHIQSKHTKEKSHQCEFCGKDFARRYSLVIHRRIHTGEKNYKCDFCDKEFRASSYLQVHRKIHTGEKPFVCDCGKRFRVRGDLKRHSNIHERNKAKHAKIEDFNCISNGLNDENNTQQSRTTDTLDQLVSVMECGDASLPGDSTDSLKMKRKFMQIEYEKNFTKLKHKRDPKTQDDSSSTILDYSTDHLLDKTLTFNKSNEKSKLI